MIEPEVGHHFLQLGVRINVAGEALGDQFFGDEALRIFERGNDFLLIGSESGSKLYTLCRSQGLEGAVEFGLAHGCKARNPLHWLERQNVVDE